MADPVKNLTNVPKELVAGATNLKIVGGVVVGVIAGTIITGLIMKKFSDNKIVKDARTGLNG